MNKAFSIIFLLLIHISVMGQKPAGNCSQKLISAQRAYDEGELERVITLLNSCLESYKYAEAIDAYKLMVLAHIFSDNPEKADELYGKLLDSDPNFIPNPATDPIELTQLHNSFRTAPRFTCGVFAGANLGQAVIAKGSEIYRIDGLRTLDRTSTLQFSTQFGAGGEWYPTSNLSVVGEFVYLSSQFKFSENVFESDQLTYIEKQQWLSFPLSLRCYFGQKNKTKFFVEMGGAFSLLQQSSASIERVVLNSQDVSGPDIDVKPLRNNMNYAATTGIGLRKSVGQMMLFFKLGLKYDIFIQNNPDKRYSNDELIFQYGYVDEDFRVLSPSISVGLNYAFYAHKRKQPRIEKSKKNSKR